MSEKIANETPTNCCLPARVLKFGGTSVKSLARINHVADIVQQSLANGPLLVVLSAMGDTTDHLLDLAYRCCPKPDPRELDQLISTGEQVSISLLAMCLLSRGINARSCTASQAGIFCDRAHGASTILNIDKEKLDSAFKQNSVIVVAGFQGLDSCGNVNTLGRGGSDTSAVALAARLGIPCDIFTDVDGIFFCRSQSYCRRRAFAPDTFHRRSGPGASGGASHSSTRRRTGQTLSCPPSRPQHFQTRFPKYYNSNRRINRGKLQDRLGRRL
ncbi:MAG: hypothetical protein K2W95_26380 [Candidatus Obscuribacterales bacterium]|nr:hypothetical protein [Candidatus Obscuribacterales bacterium]